MADDKVIDITARFNEPPPIEVRRAGWDECGHRHTVIDQTLRTVSCADCGEERLDPIEVLLSIARQWARWRHEAETLKRLNAEYQRNRREQWERSRDRHLNAHPDHRATFNPHRSSWDGDMCGQCRRLELRYDRRWDVATTP